MINKFEGKYEFLSNFAKSPIIGVDDGIVYPTMEHYFQAQKTMDFEKRKEIAQAPTPGKAKRLGRHVKLRADWEQVKDKIMFTGLVEKFSQDPFQQQLIDTGDEYLEEGNWWHDNYWGVCSCVDCQDKKGGNHLGKLLMDVRSMIKAGSGVRDMKWHIWSSKLEEYPLCWEDKALEFDTEADARSFLEYAIRASEHNEEFYKDVVVSESILYYDGGYIDATNLRVCWDFSLEDNVLKNVADIDLKPAD